MSSAIRSFLLLFFLLSGMNLDAQDTKTFDSFIPKLMPAKGHNRQVKRAQYSPNGKQVLTASDFTAKIWDAGSGKLLLELLGHTRRFTSVQYSPNGKQVLTASMDGTAKIWDAVSGKLLLDLLGHTDYIWSARYSPDGKHIVTASRDSTAKIWDAVSGKLLLDLLGHTDYIWSARYSPDGKQVLTASSDSTTKIWDAGSGKLLLEFRGHTGSVYSARYSPDGKQVLTASGAKTAKIWDAGSGKLLLDLIGHTDEVYRARYSPDGKKVLTTSRDGTAKIWDASSGKLLLDLRGHTDYVRAQYSPNGKHILTTSRDSTAKIWDAGSGKLLLDLSGHTGQVRSARYSPDGKHIVTTSGDKTAKIWDAVSGKLLLDLLGHTDLIQFAQYNPDGKQVLTASDHSAKIWDAGSGKLLHNLLGHTDYVLSALYSPDGKQIVTASRDSTAKIWDAGSGKLLHNLLGHTDYVLSALYSPDGKHIVTASRDSTAKVWDPSSGKLLLDLLGHTAYIWSALYSPDGKQVLMTSDSTAKICDAGSGKLLVDLSGHTDYIWSARYSPDGKHIVTASRDSTAKIWDAVSGKLLVDLLGHTDEVRSAQYSPDGKQILTTSRDGTAKIWDASTGKLLLDFVHTGIVWSAQFSPDGKQVLTKSSDNMTKIWDAVSGKLLLDLNGHAGFTWSLQYSPDGKYILTSSDDGSIIFWKAETGEQLISMYPLSEYEWVAIHPSGLFDASPKAMEWMYYLVGQEVIELEQLKERYYEPGLFEKAMAQNGSLRDVEAFTAVKMYPEIESSIKEQKLHIHLKERNGGIGKVSLFVNNKEVIPDANANRDTALSIDLSRFEKYYLKDTLNTISFRAYTADGWLKSSAISHSYTPEFINKRGAAGGRVLHHLRHDPHLYAVLIGTSDYLGNDLDLKFADKDAKDMASAIGQSSRLLFGADKVHLECFTSSGLPGSKSGSKNNIKAAFDTIAANANAEDILLIYLAGHGVVHGGTENEQFYYLTKDVSSGDLSDPLIRSSYAISTEDLTQWINSIAAQKQVMILDACSSGKVVDDLLAMRNVPSSQIRALDRMKDRTGMFVLAGSAADKVSYEASQFGQGLLTYSLLLGMSGAALKDGQSVDVMELFQYARDRVPEFAKDIGGVQVPTLTSPTDASSFDIGLVTEEIEIPLQEVKPLFTRSSFQDEESFRDIIRISKALDTYLVNVSSGPSSRGIIFVDINEYENAYTVNGRYNLDGDKVSLQGRLYKGKEKFGDFTVTGDKNQIEKIVQGILDEVLGIINP